MNRTQRIDRIRRPPPDRIEFRSTESELLLDRDIRTIHDQVDRGAWAKSVCASQTSVMAEFCSLSPLATWLSVEATLWGEGRGEGTSASRKVTPSPQPTPP